MAVPTTTHSNTIDDCFLILFSFLILLMFIGFAFLEAGAVRLKNVTDTIIKKIIIYFTSVIAFWLFGYAFAWGEKSNGFLSHSNFGLSDIPTEGASNFYIHWTYHSCIAAVACSIVSGALAERTNFSVYLIYTAVFSGFVFPVASHWCWHPEGWLGKGNIDELGEGVVFQDYAGCAVIHVASGIMALVGAAVSGPRNARFERGKPVPIGGHTVPLIAVGGFFTHLGILALHVSQNGHISQRGDAQSIGNAAVTTIIASSFGGLTAFFIRRTWGACYGHHSSVLTLFQGALTGAVSVSAGCNVIYPYAACCIGFIAGATYIAWDILLVHLKIDDPLTTISVHLGGGVWGLIATPLFNKHDGILYIGDKRSFKILGWYLLGGIAIVLWTTVFSLSLFFILKYFKKLRVTPEIEHKGLDIGKHGEPAYPLGSYADDYHVTHGVSTMRARPATIVNESHNPAFSTDLQLSSLAGSYIPTTDRSNGLQTITRSQASTSPI